MYATVLYLTSDSHFVGQHHCYRPWCWLFPNVSPWMSPFCRYWGNRKIKKLSSLTNDWMQSSHFSKITGCGVGPLGSWASKEIFRFFSGWTVKGGLLYSYNKRANHTPLNNLDFNYFPLIFENFLPYHCLTKTFTVYQIANWKIICPCSIKVP